MFPFAWLRGYYPGLGPHEAVKANLDVLARLDITPLDTPEPELTYLFKHIVTQEVAYESLAYATRAQLHEQLAQYLEGQNTDKYLDRMAFHYGRSENVAKQREYFRRAGDAAAAAFANEAALDYYGRLLQQLAEPADKADLLLRQGAVLELIGRREEAEQQYRGALALAGQDVVQTARSQAALGELCRKWGKFEAALDWLAQARQGYEVLHDHAGLAWALVETGRVVLRQGDVLAAGPYFHESLALAREGNDRRGMARSLSGLAELASYQGDYAAARALSEECLRLARATGAKEYISGALNLLAAYAAVARDYTAAWALLEEGLVLSRDIGDKGGMASTLLNLGELSTLEGDYMRARALTQESMALARMVDNKQLIALLLNNLGHLALYLRDHAAARTLLNESLTLWHKIGVKGIKIYPLNGLAAVAVERPGEIAKASQLLGAIEALCAVTGYVLDPADRKLYERTVSTAKTALGDEAFNAAFEAGKQMSLDEAVQLGLGEN